MAQNFYRKNGIAGIPGRNLNSVRGALDVSGLYPVRRRQDGSPMQGESLSQAEMLPMTPTLEQLQERAGILSTYLGDSGYAAERETAQSNAKLQAYLSLAEAGFGWMGAQPGEGESPMSVMGRAFAAPLAGRMSTLAGTFAEQDAARRDAQRAEERAVKLQALEDLQPSYTQTTDLERLVNGEWRPFSGFVQTDSVYGPRYIEMGEGGKRTEVPSDEIRQWREPVDLPKPTGSSVENQVVQVPIRDKDDNIVGWHDVNVQQVQQIRQTDDGPIIEWGRVYPLGSSLPWTVDGELATEGVHYIGTDKAHWGDPEKTTYFLRTGLSEEENAAARARLGRNLREGEAVQRWDFVHNVNPELKKFWYDVKGLAVNLTPDEANRWLTDQRPTDVFPEGGKPFGTTVREFTVTDKDTGEPKTVTAVLWQSEPGIFQWRETGEGGTYLDEEYQQAFWETIKEDKDWQSFRPVLDEAFKSAVGLRTDLDADTRELLSKQILTTADLKKLAPLNPIDRNKALNDLINARIGKLTGERGETPVVIPQSVLELDPRVNAMTTVPQNAAGFTRPVVNPRIFQPWTRGAQNIQLGTGSHSGFTQNVTQDDITQGRRNWPAIKQSFEQIYGGARPLGDEEERVLLFSGLWKNLPGVAEGQKARTLGDEAFRIAFDKATSLYNSAAGEYKPAAEIDIGKGAQAKNLQTSLDDDLDALRDNVIMFRFKDQAGAWFSDGAWLAEMRGTGLGELVEAWSGTDGVERNMPSDRWADIAKPDDQLNAKDLALKKQALAYLAERSNSEKGLTIGITEFERAAEYLGALSRYKIRAFSMIADSRPSDRDIEILLAAFVGKRDSDSVVFAKLYELQNRHVMGLSRRLNQGLSMKAIYDPVFLANLDHTSRALQRLAVRDVDLTPGGRAEESAALFRRSSGIIQRATEAASGRIIPGHRGGVISPFSLNVDEESTANLYRRVLSAAKEAYPEKNDQEAIEEFVRQGLHLTRFLGVYGISSPTTPPYVEEPDGSITIQ